MQASVHSYDEETGTGRLVTDAGAVLPVAPDVVAAAGLRRLRVGQRLAVASDDDGRVTRVTIPGLAPRETPARATGA